MSLGGGGGDTTDTEEPGGEITTLSDKRVTYLANWTPSSVPKASPAST